MYLPDSSSCFYLCRLCMCVFFLYIVSEFLSSLPCPPSPFPPQQNPQKVYVSCAISSSCCIVDQAFPQILYIAFVELYLESCTKRTPKVSTIGFICELANSRNIKKSIESKPNKPDVYISLPFAQRVEVEKERYTQRARAHTHKTNQSIHSTVFLIAAPARSSLHQSDEF